MGTSSWLATLMDVELLARNGTTILPPLRPGVSYPERTGFEVAAELGGALLLRYITAEQLGRFDRGTEERSYATPTPYTPEEAVPWLLLPKAAVPRTHALLLDPARIARVIGPMWV